MKRSAMHSAAGRPSDDDRRRRIPKVVPLGHKIRDLVERAHNKIDELHLCDGTQTEVAHPARRANNRGFADRRINHALPAKSFE